MSLRKDLALVADLVPEASRVLDLGCGSGDLLYHLVQERRCRGTGVEIDPGMVLGAIRLGVPVIELDIDRELDGFADSSYDVVVLSHLVHDLVDVDAAAVLDLARRLTRPGGSVVVFELPGDPPGAFGPLFDLMMRIETPGAARRVDELVELLAAAGLAEIAEVPGTARPHVVLRGWVPD